MIRARDVSPKQMNETHAKGTHGLTGRSMPISLAFPARATTCAKTNNRIGSSTYT
jgi:hypothetical protein